jgi:probable HAF family extracellular repeat protein
VRVIKEEPASMPNYNYVKFDDPLGQWSTVSPTGITTTGRTIGSGINDTGQITGYYEDSAGAVHGFLDNWGSYTTLDDPLATQGTFALGINGKGQIVGYYTNAAGKHGFLYSGASYTTLDDPLGMPGATYQRLRTDRRVLLRRERPRTRLRL